MNGTKIYIFPDKNDIKLSAATQTCRTLTKEEEEEEDDKEEKEEEEGGKEDMTCKFLTLCPPTSWMQPTKHTESKHGHCGNITFRNLFLLSESWGRPLEVHPRVFATSGRLTHPKKSTIPGEVGH